jgi:alkyldihydroxyacetonephosphate synthase
MRVQDRPAFRAAATARFATFTAGVDAARAIAQSGLHPANCRLVDAAEAMLTGAGDGSAHLLLLAFESADHPLDAWLSRAIECARDHGAEVDEPQPTTGEPGRAGAAGPAHRAGAAGAWRSAFLRAPYTRDALVGLGLVNETFETACTWSSFPALYDAVMRTVRETLARVGADPGLVTCRFTHVYPDGPAPYFTVIAAGAREPAARLEQWAAVKAAASEELMAYGATITHHHAVGRDHRAWYDRQRPDLFADALRAAKATLDPHATLNPGVLLDPSPRSGGTRSP